MTSTIRYFLYNNVEYSLNNLAILCLGMEEKDVKRIESID